MLLSIMLAWLAVILSIMTILKYVARISGNRALNRFFHKIHIPFGVLLIIVGAAHGILAGNPSTSTLADFQPAAVLFTLNWGTASILLAIALGATYLLRKKLKHIWMLLHRAATVAIIICLVLHICDVGIQLPGRLLNLYSSATGTEAQQNYDYYQSAEISESDDTHSDEAGIVTFSGAQLNDGTYQGSATGYSGTINVSVSVVNGQVTEIEVISESDTQRFFEQAKKVLTSIVDQQSLQVDAISGATISSAGLINAVYDALKDAVSSGTLSVADIDLSSVHQHIKK